MPAPQAGARSTRLLSLQICELTIKGANLLFFFRILLLVFFLGAACTATSLFALFSQEQGAAVDMDGPPLAEIAVGHFFLVSV